MHLKFNTNTHNYGCDFEESIIKIKQILIETDKLYTHLYTFFMDLYIIRRVIDKDYITNSIIYTGILHTTNIARILVKYFDFKITNTFYSKYSIKETNDKYKKEDLYDNYILGGINKYDLFPDYLTQCSNMKGFPDMFR